MNLKKLNETLSQILKEELTDYESINEIAAKLDKLNIAYYVTENMLMIKPQLDFKYEFAILLNEMDKRIYIQILPDVEIAGEYNTGYSETRLDPDMEIMPQLEKAYVTGLKKATQELFRFKNENPDYNSYSADAKDLLEGNR